MGLRDNLKSEKAKERYDRNFNSVETIYSQRELEEHDKEIRTKVIDEFVKNYKKSNIIAKDVRDRIFDMIQFGKCDVDEVAEVIDKQYCDFIEKIADEMRGSEENM